MKKALSGLNKNLIASFNWYSKLNAYDNKYRIRISILLLFIFSAIIGCYFYFKQIYQQPGGGFGIPVEASPVKIMKLTRNIDAVGVLSANESVIIRPEIAGRIVEILFKEGQDVGKDAPIIKLEDSIAAASLKEITARYELSKAEYERASTLLQKSVGSINDRDVAFSKYQANEAELARETATFKKMTILSPFSGTLGLRKVNIGDYVNAGQDLVNLVDYTPIKIDFRIPEVYLNDIKMGQTLEVTTDAFKGKKFTGTIVAIDPAIDPLGHSILIRAEIPNQDKLLRPGLFVDLNLTYAEIPDALMIPDETVFLQNGKPYVYVIKEGKAILTEVALGDRHNNQVQVTQGLNPQDIVITAGQMKIKPFFPVTPINLAGTAP